MVPIEQVAAELLDAAARARALSAETHPVSVYAGRWKAGPSRRAMLVALRRVAEVASRGALTEWSCPWSAFRARHAESVRVELAAMRFETTANQRLAALRAMVRVCAELGLMRREDCDAIVIAARTLPARRGVIAPLPEGTVERLLRACNDGSPRGVRDGAVIAGLAAGLSRAKLVALPVSAWCPLRRALDVAASGKRRRFIAVDEMLAQHIERWLMLRGAADGPLFVNVHHRGRVRLRGLRPVTITDIVRVRARRAGVGRLRPEALRHRSLAARLEGQSIEVARRAAGHSRARTTVRYIGA